MRTHQAKFIAGAAEIARLPRLDHPQIAFAGRSNVGKSSLINRLTSRHALARVSKTPGRTQQINFFLIDETIVFVDLPGYGFARVPLVVKDHWKRLVEGYLTSPVRPVFAVVIVDIRRGLQDEDEVLLDFLGNLGIPCVVAATKIDRISRSERHKLRKAIDDRLPAKTALVLCSSTTGEGVGELWQMFDRHCF